MALKQSFGKPPLAPPKASVQHQQPASNKQQAGGVLLNIPTSLSNMQQRPVSQQTSAFTSTTTSAPGLRQQLNMPPVSMNTLTCGGASASSAIEQLKKHADTMALQEQNAALKVKDLNLKLEAVETARKVLEKDLLSEQTKTRELEVQHLEDVKQFEMTMSKLEMVFKNQVVLERDMQLAKQTISQASENESLINSRWQEQEHEVQELCSKYSELDQARADLQDELTSALDKVDDKERELIKARLAGSNLESEIMTLKEQLQMLEEERVSLKEQADVLGASLSSAELQLVALRVAATQQADRLAEAQGLLSSTNSDFDALKCLLTEEQAKVAAAEHEMAIMVHRVQGLESELTDCKRKSRCQEEDLADLVTAHKLKADAMMELEQEDYLL